MKSEPIMKVEGTEAPIAVVYKVKEEGKECRGFEESRSSPTSLSATTMITVPPISIVSTKSSAAASTTANGTESNIITSLTTTPFANGSRSPTGHTHTASALLPPSSSSTTRESSTVISRASTPSTILTMVNTSPESYSVDLDLKTKVPQVLPNGPSPSHEISSKDRGNSEKNSETAPRERDGPSPCSIGKTKVHQQDHRVNGTQTECAREYAASSGTESPLSAHPIKPENEDSPSSRQHDETEINNETDTMQISNGTSSGPRCITGIFAGHGKLKRLLGTLIQFATNISQDTGDSVRTLVLGLLSGAMTAEEFHSALQEATNVPLRGFVLPYLRHTVPSLRRDLNSAARSNNQTCMRYLQLNESALLETVNLAPSSETVELFGDRNNVNGISATNLAYSCSTNYGIARSGSAAGVGAIQHTNNNTGTLHHHFSSIPTNLATKRRASDTSFYENGSCSLDDGPIYGKRSSSLWPHLSPPRQQPPEPYCWYPLHSSGGSIQSNSQNHRHAPSPVPPSLVQANHQLTSFGPPQLSHQPQLGTGSIQNSSSLDDEWKNIHVMLNCILGMVEKTKRALAILQRRGGSPPSPAATAPPLTPGSNPHNGNTNGNSSCSNASHGESSSGPDRDTGNFKRLSGEFIAQTIRVTEDKVAEVKRRAEEAVQEVKRAAVVEVQRAVAVAVAESRANERLRVHRLLDLPLPHKGHGSPRQSSLIRVAAHIDSTNPEASSVRTAAGGPLATTQFSSTGSRLATDEKDVLRMTNVNGSGCWNCGRTALETCGGCGVARYCGYFCQHRDWEAGGHHATCNSRPSRDSPGRSSSRSPAPRSTTDALLNSNDNYSNGVSTTATPAK